MSLQAHHRCKPGLNAIPETKKRLLKRRLGAVEWNIGTGVADSRRLMGEIGYAYLTYYRISILRVSLSCLNGLALNPLRLRSEEKWQRPRSVRQSINP